MDTLNQFQESNQSILLAGNYRGGIAVGDCIKNVYKIAEDVSSQILST
jgi:protoporphyrinogen oxidase